MNNKFLLMIELVSLLFLFSIGFVAAQDDDGGLPKPASMDSADADNPGMPWLDLATDEKLRAQDITDFGKVIGLCRRARKEGLAGDNLVYCDQLRAAAQLQRGLFVSQELLGKPVNTLPKDWEAARLRVLADLEEAITVIKDNPLPYIRIAQLNTALPDGDEKRAAEVLDLALENVKSDPNTYVQVVVLRAALEKDPVKRGKFVADKAKGSTNAQLLMLHVLNLIELKQMDAASAVLHRILELEPDNMKALDLAFELLVNQKAYDEALKILDKLEKINDDDGILQRRVKLFTQMGKHAEAIGLLDELRKKHPDNPQILFIRSLLYVEIKDYDKALKDVDAGNRLFPDNPIFLLQKIKILTAKEQFADAVKIADDLVKDHPENVEFLLTKLQLLLAQKDFDKAVAIVDDLRSKQPDEEKWTLLKIQILSEAKKHDDALAFIDELSKKSPDDEKWAIFKIQILNEVKKYDDSLAVVESQLKKQPGEEKWFLVKAQILADAKKYDEAFAILEDIHKKSPDKIEITLNLVSLLSLQKKNRKALEYLTPLLEKEPENVALIRVKSQILIALNRFADAVKALEAVIKAEPDDEVSINNLSWILSTSPVESIRNGKRALELAEQAAKLTEYKKAYILSTLAAAYAETGDFDKAAEWSQKSIDTAKEDDNVKDRIDDLQKELDSYKQKKPYREVTPEEKE